MTPSTPTQLALARYHAQYDNETYTAIRNALLHDAGYGTRQDHPDLTAIMNRVTDICLALCDHPDYSKSFTTLMQELGNFDASPETVRLIGQHFENFEEDGSPFSAEFEHTTIVYLAVQAFQLSRTTWEAEYIRSQAGKTARELLAAAQQLIRLTGLILIEEPCSLYTQERWQQAQTHLDLAKKHLQNVPITRFEPFRTLVMSSDRTYVGLVEERSSNGQAVKIRWYKWGYTSPDTIVEWVVASALYRLTTLTERECLERFDTFPPHYQR